MFDAPGPVAFQTEYTARNPSRFICHPAVTPGWSWIPPVGTAKAAGLETRAAIHCGRILAIQSGLHTV